MKEEELQTPKIDLNLCTSDRNIPPLDKVFMMDEDSFEDFTVEWLYGCRSSKYNKIVRIGGAGDKGRDAIGYNQDGSCDYYQCKHYDSPLSPSVYDVEFGKLCYYTWNNEIKTPKKYYIVASHNIGSKLLKLIQDPKELKKELIETWDAHCKKNITDTQDIILSEELKKYINEFDFSIVEYIPIEEIINEHIKTVYGKIRFGGQKISQPDKLNVPKNPTEQELPYISALLSAYSDADNKEYKSVKDIFENEKYQNHLNRQRESFYCAETLKRFVRDTCTSEEEYVYLENDIYEGIIDIHEMVYKNGYERLQSDLTQASKNVSRSILEKNLNWLGPKEKKGICHELANDKKIKWVDEDEKNN